QARLSRELVRLRRDLPVAIDWEAARVGHWDAVRLQALFREFGFRRFGDEVRALPAVSAATPVAAVATPGSARRGESLFPEDPTEDPGERSLASSRQAASDVSPARSGKRPLDFTIVDTPDKLAALVGQLKGRRQFCLDLETTALDPMRAEIVGWAISWEPHKGYYIAVRGPAGQTLLDPELVVRVLRPILEEPSVEVCNHNINYDVLVLGRAGSSLC